MAEKIIYAPGTMLLMFNAETGDVYIADANTKEKIRDVSEKELLYKIFNELTKYNGGPCDKCTLRDG